MEEVECGIEELYGMPNKVPQTQGQIRTFYGVQFWLADESDVRVTDQIETLDLALQKARELSKAGKGYHDFDIYAYHAEYINEPFTHQGVTHPYWHWVKIDDGFVKNWDINGRELT